MNLFARGLGALGLMLVVGTSQADDAINIYAWQNWSFEIVDTGGDREYTRLQNNAANIGFSAQVDSGLDGIQVGFRCEQYTFFAGAESNAGTTNRQWCTRNSKFSLIHETAGELMIGTWLLPYNEIVAQWVSQGYDSDNTGHSALMGDAGGSHGSTTLGGFYSPGFGAYGYTSFERRQENIIQYTWPSLAEANSQTREGFQFRAAITDGKDNDTPLANGTTVDPYIFSSGVAYQANTANGGQVWAAFAYEKHNDWTVGQYALASSDFVLTHPAAVGTSAAEVELGTCTGSDDEGYRLAGRYIHPWAGTGMKSSISVMWETLEWQVSGCAGGNGSAEKDTWLVYGTHNFGNGFDVRATYADADNLDITESLIDFTGDIPNTGADFLSAGVYYTAPAGTEFRITYAEIDNEANADYDFGNDSVGVGPGDDPEIVSFGVIQWFD